MQEHHRRAPWPERVRRQAVPAFRAERGIGPGCTKRLDAQFQAERIVLDSLATLEYIARRRVAFIACSERQVVNYLLVVRRSLRCLISPFAFERTLDRAIRKRAGPRRIDAGHRAREFERCAKVGAITAEIDVIHGAA